MAAFHVALFVRGIKSGLERDVIMETLFLRVVNATRDSEGHRETEFLSHSSTRCETLCNDFLNYPITRDYQIARSLLPQLFKEPDDALNPAVEVGDVEIGRAS